MAAAKQLHWLHAVSFPHWLLKKVEACLLSDALTSPRKQTDTFIRHWEKTAEIPHHQKQYSNVYTTGGITLFVSLFPYLPRQNKAQLQKKIVERGTTSGTAGRKLVMAGKQKLRACYSLMEGDMNKPPTPLTTTIMHYLLIWMPVRLSTWEALMRHLTMITTAAWAAVCTLLKTKESKLFAGRWQSSLLFFTVVVKLTKNWWRSYLCTFYIWFVL